MPKTEMDRVKVKVMEVDVDRKRIGLSLRLTDEPGAPAPKRKNQNSGQRRDKQTDNRSAGRAGERGGQGQRRQATSPAAGGAMADALKRAGLGRYTSPLIPPGRLSSS